MGVLDAWAYGIPCVVTPVGGLPDIVIDGENALVFPVGDVDMLSSQLKKMISDGFLREKIAQASLELAHTTFNIDCINKKWKISMNDLSKKRLYSLDMMKCMAAIFITNSHFQPLYEGVNTAFATFVKINNDRLARKIKTLLYSLLLKRSKLLENKQKTV